MEYVLHWIAETVEFRGRMIARGFRTEVTGIAMHKRNEPGFARFDVFVLNDWR